MKKIILSILVFFLLTVPVSAHILETDGNIGGVLHIDPNDDPVVGQESTIFLELKDKTSAFHPDQCTCTFSIIRSEQILTTQPLFGDNITDTTAHFSYIFPQKDIYTIKIHGIPDIPSRFQSFTLTYVVRVEQEIQPVKPNQHMSPISPVLLIGFVAMFALVLVYLFLGKRWKLIAIILLGFLWIHSLPITVSAKNMHMHDHAEADHTCCLPQQAVFPPEVHVVPSISKLLVIIQTIPESLEKLENDLFRNRSP